MSLNHDQLSSHCQREMLRHWKNGLWKNSPISKQVYLAGAYSNWPCPDGAMYDPKNNISVGIEFKPDTESKRGIQTGIGQSLTYLDKFSTSYLIIPKNVEEYNISDYLKKVFNNEVRGKMPIGLISYEISDSIEIKMLVDIDLGLNILTRTERGVGRYWAKFVDTNPHIIFLALDTSFKFNKKVNNRKEAIWKIFFDKYYFPKEHRETLVPFKSEINHWDKKKMEPFRDKIKSLNQLIDDGVITREKAIEELRQHTFKDGRPTLTKSSQNDNLYKSFKKNYFTFLDHLQLWDIDANLTNLGKELYDIGIEFGYDSTKYFNRLSKIILVQGKHYDLIKDIKKYTHGLEFDSVTKAKEHVFNKFEEDGLIKRNEGRAVEKGRTKLFSMQFQAWTKLQIISGRAEERYIPGYGFNFNEKRINEIIESYS